MFYLQGKEVKIEYYNDGTPKIVINLSDYNKEVFDEDFIILKWMFEPNEEFFIAFIKNYIDEKFPTKKIYFLMPYLPYAREDKWKDNQSFTLKYFAKFINELKFHKVITWDVHSTAAFMINRLRSFMPVPILTNSKFETLEEAISIRNYLMTDFRKNHFTVLKEIVNDIQPDILFYPDEGSMKRYQDEFDKEYIFGIKKRKFKTREIVKYELHGKPSSEEFSVLIIDDICSTGETLLQAAKLLKSKGANKIYVYITHCEKSVFKGDLLKTGYIDMLYTTNSLMYSEDTYDDPVIGRSKIGNNTSIKIYNCI